jgi:hypothetical protein
MASYDYATVEAYSDEHRFELYVPFNQKEIGQFVKEKFRAGFKTDGAKKRWVVEYEFSKAREAEIAAAVENELYRTGAPAWRDIVKTFANYACASRRYEVRFAAGGIRIMLPGGHPLHYYLGQMTGLKPERDVWKIPSNLVDQKEIAPMLKRIADEDRGVYKEATEPYEGRSVTGKLLIPWSRADEFRLVTDSVVFADYSFVKTVDPQIVPMPIHAWPFRVNKTVPAEGGIEVTLAYLDADPGARAVGRLMAMKLEERPSLLDEAHAEGKWKSRSSF